MPNLLNLRLISQSLRSLPYSFSSHFTIAISVKSVQWRLLYCQHLQPEVNIVLDKHQIYYDFDSNALFSEIKKKLILKWQLTIGN